MQDSTFFSMEDVSLLILAAFERSGGDNGSDF